MQGQRDLHGFQCKVYNKQSPSVDFSVSVIFTVSTFQCKRQYLELGFSARLQSIGDSLWCINMKLLKLHCGSCSTLWKLIMNAHLNVPGLSIVMFHLHIMTVGCFGGGGGGCDTLVSPILEGWVKYVADSRWWIQVSQIKAGSRIEWINNVRKKGT
ncbi:hypothetical protein F0562_035996 [Nyssa sinensis]|uniref:Uncharacterized protein n=1 Tax=Nyssa sinensis TaxID=561372 RepID=A0A5J5AHM1_9ASTE|nr:hypothetical protein F0562_035996 [Nyssa sinensis]